MSRYRTTIALAVFGILLILAMVGLVLITDNEEHDVTTDREQLETQIAGILPDLDPGQRALLADELTNWLRDRDWPRLQEHGSQIAGEIEAEAERASAIGPERYSVTRAFAYAAQVARNTN